MSHESSLANPTLDARRSLPVSHSYRVRKLYPHWLNIAKKTLHIPAGNRSVRRAYCAARNSERRAVCRGMKCPKQARDIQQKYQFTSFLQSLAHLPG